MVPGEPGLGKQLAADGSHLPPSLWGGGKRYKKLAGLTVSPVCGVTAGPAASPSLTHKEPAYVLLLGKASVPSALTEAVGHVRMCYLAR